MRLRDKTSVELSLEPFPGTPTHSRILVHIFIEGQLLASHQLLVGPTQDVKAFFDGEISLLELRKRLFGEAIAEDLLDQFDGF